MSFFYDLPQISEEAMRLSMLCLEYDMSHSWWHCLKKLQEPHGGGTSLEEVGRWGWHLSLPSPAPLAAHSSLPECRCNVTSQLPAPSTVPSSLADSVPWCTAASGTAGQNNPLSLEMLFLQGISRQEAINISSKLHTFIHSKPLCI